MIPGPKFKKNQLVKDIKLGYVWKITGIYKQISNKNQEFKCYGYNVVCVSKTIKHSSSVLTEKDIKELSPLEELL